MLSTCSGIHTHDGSTIPNEVPVGLAQLFKTMRAFNLLGYPCTQNGAGKKFLTDLLAAVSQNKDWFTAASTTTDPRMDWCGYPACEDTQLHGKGLICCCLLSYLAHTV